jgi:hypothetical protein
LDPEACSARICSGQELQSLGWPIIVIIVKVPACISRVPLLVGNRLLHDAPLSNEAGNAHVDEHRPHTGQSCWQSAATTNIV